MGKNVLDLKEDNTGSASLVYILYLSSILLGITALVGVVIAYMNREDAPEWLKTHYTYMINTFWKGLLYGLISMILTVILIGLVLFLVVLVWWIVRCIKGMKALGKSEPIAKPKGWGF